MLSGLSKEKIINIWCGTLVISNVLNILYIAYTFYVIIIYLGIFMAVAPAIPYIVRNPHEPSPVYWRNYKNDPLRTIIYSILCILYGITVAIALL